MALSGHVTWDLSMAGTRVCCARRLTRAFTSATICRINTMRGENRPIPPECLAPFETGNKHTNKVENPAFRIGTPFPPAGIIAGQLDLQFKNCLDRPWVFWH